MYLLDVGSCKKFEAVPLSHSAAIFMTFLLIPSQNLFFGCTYLKHIHYSEMSPLM